MCPQAGIIYMLLVEDDPGDVELTREALKGSACRVSLDAVSDGEEAMKYLRQAPPYEEAPRPDLILMDLNLPRMDGREALKEIKSDPALKAIPVLVLTTSEARRDIAYCYEAGANCYLIKPIGFEEFRATVRAIEDFWFRLVRLPGGE